MWITFFALHHYHITPCTPLNPFPSIATCCTWPKAEMQSSRAACIPAWKACWASATWRAASPDKTPPTCRPSRTLQKRSKAPTWKPVPSMVWCSATSVPRPSTTISRTLPAGCPASTRGQSATPSNSPTSAACWSSTTIVFGLCRRAARQRARIHRAFRRRAPHALFHRVHSRLRRARPPLRRAPRGILCAHGRGLGGGRVLHPFPEHTLPIFEQHRLPLWTHNKALQKSASRSAPMRPSKPN